MESLRGAAYVGGISLRSPSQCSFLPAKCLLKARIWPRTGRSRTLSPLSNLSYASAKRNDEVGEEDDDATLGRTGPNFGMVMPNLTTAEQDYLEAATSNPDYMRRMTEIVRRKDQERKAAMSAQNAQGADEYLEGLARPTAPPSDAAPPRVSASDAYMEDLARKSRAYRGIEDPPMENRRSSTAPAGPASISEEENLNDLESLEDRIKRLQETLSKVKDDIDPNSTIEDAISIRDMIRRDIGLDPPSELPREPEPALEPVNEPTQETVPEPPPKPQAIDKQIIFLQDYLEKLKQEEANEEVFEEETDTEVTSQVQMKEELESNMNQIADKFTPKIEGLADTPGGMSAAEKMAAFQQVREQAMKGSNQEPQFFDPYNVVLPSEKSADDDGQEPSSSSEAEYDEIGTQIHNKDLLIEEIETEVARYVVNARSLLQKHDARMQVLIARLRALK
ncbi:unnamed protein product [Agarophyton chilense]|eukprot:gb/GEZJ01000032.1/.p3 GENE.gb/GEZJ01000032.1/~~gb/GEZJ01000032.1/.p3  ORF type:complete len:450 (-),score=96.25 gb/GEZJ01000032.1/:333-1682(-)